MNKKVSLLFLTSILLASCVSVSVDSQTLTPVQADFVTSTLQPTVPGFVPATVTPSPEVTIAPTLAITAPANCKDSAVLLRDVTIPDNTQVKPNETFTKTWEFQNNGTCPWVNYVLKFSSGDQMNAPLTAPIPDTAPKSNVQVSVSLTAPSLDGVFTGYYTLTNSNGNDVFIGTEKTFWVKIVVGSGAIVPTVGISNPVQSGNSTSNGANCNYSPNAGYVNQLVSLINTERQNAGLGALTVDSSLQTAAQKHSEDMACNNFLSHTGSNGSVIGTRLRDAGYASIGFSEIIAIGTPQNAMDQWRADPGHWEIVINPGHTKLGVGYAYSAASDYGGYITVDFGN